MSLVGTRPPTVDEWEQYELHHRSRMSTKPGILELIHYVKVTKSDRYSNNNGQIICSPKAPVQLPFLN